MVTKLYRVSDGTVHLPVLRKDLVALRLTQPSSDLNSLAYFQSSIMIAE